MSRITLIAATLAGAALISTGAIAQAPPTTSPPSGTANKLSQAECDTIWSKANPSGAGSLSMSQAQSYVTDFKSVDSDNDGKLSQSEFTKGCKDGHVKSSAATGAGSGASGSSPGGAPAGSPGSKMK